MNSSATASSIVTASIGADKSAAAHQGKPQASFMKRLFAAWVRPYENCTFPFMGL